jgi:hypothetical protein
MSDGASKFWLISRLVPPLWRPARRKFRGEQMEESKRQAVEFLEKEIKTYIALALFLSRKGTREKLLVGDKEVVLNSGYYNERMKEARKIVNKLRKPS